MVTFVQRATVDDSGTFISGVNFNADGTKLFTVYNTKASGDYSHVSAVSYTHLTLPTNDVV